MSDDKAFDDCMILSKSAFDPDAVFLDDIVDDDVLPKANLAVDGLTSFWQARGGRLEIGAEDIPGDEQFEPDTELPMGATEPHELEVYGFETSLWQRFRSYIGF